MLKQVHVNWCTSWSVIEKKYNKCADVKCIKCYFVLRVITPRFWGRTENVALLIYYVFIFV
jgi:hypothetical protein